ncbi:HNH endonuclease [Acetobacterium wieringae]|jgi:5-methylcytosine-specific restriction endonuclease McrA|uniref:CRISPR-associated endonuclease Cas9 n=1 Tax=Acetobacterium wieringae TaxID=52694 RepID=A0A1F2PKY0_9FIRM|nr:HNH endonuclease signature motif containing protein [Acetobacterium wieringae]OFV71524.1 CRISPR-associated endonuclease Cas9 [Acetobacterium wieringae]
MSRKKLNQSERKKIFNKTDGHCAYCGTELEFGKMQIDHIVPISRGGEDDEKNMIAACRSCNHYKSTLFLEEFRSEIEKWHQRLMRDSVTYKNAIRYGVVEHKSKEIVFYFETIQ